MYDKYIKYFINVLGLSFWGKSTEAFKALIVCWRGMGGKVSQISKNNKNKIKKYVFRNIFIYKI